MDFPLAGIRVLDLTSALSGPFCSMVLADLGADVVKVEPTPSGDMIRAWGPYDQIKMEALKDGCVRRPPPMLGEHTYEVLSEFGFTEAQLHELANDGVITRYQVAQHA